MWNLHECVLVVKELCQSHGDAHMAKVLHEVHIDYNLTDKVRIFKKKLYTFWYYILFYIVVHDYC